MLTEFCVMLLKPVVIEMLLTPPVMLLFMSPTLPVMNWVTAPVTFCVWVLVAEAAPAVAALVAVFAWFVVFD